MVLAGIALRSRVNGKDCEMIHAPVQAILPRRGAPPLPRARLALAFAFPRLPELLPPQEPEQAKGRQGGQHKGGHHREA